MSKGTAVATMLVRLGISAIPVPSIVTSLINVAQQAVEAKIRSYLHERKLVGGPVTEEENVKFKLKELSVEDLDRYRWKLKEAVEQLNQKAGTIEGTWAAGQKDGKPCNAWLDLAEALAQAERRYTILSLSAGGLKRAMDEALNWSNKQATEINKFKDSLGLRFKAVIEAEEAECAKAEQAKKGGAEEFMNARHANCSNYCHWSEVAVKENEQWTSIKSKLAMITKEIADPIGVEMFLSTSADPYSMQEKGVSASS